MWEPQGVVWDIQIVFNAFIIAMLELGVDRGIRCDARRGIGVTLLDHVDGSFLIILNPNHVDEVAWPQPRLMYRTQIRAALYVIHVVGGSVSQAVGLGLVVLHRGFVLEEPEARRGGWLATSGAPFRSRYDHKICTKSCRMAGPSWSGRSIVGSGYLLISVTSSPDIHGPGPLFRGVVPPA